MIHYTTIIQVSHGLVTSVRAHMGHMGSFAVEAYLDGLERGVEDGTQVSFHRMELHADVGDQTGSTVMHVYSNGSWHTAT